MVFKTTSVLEISKSALQRNVNFLKSIIGPDVRFSSVVKGNAYGHGIEQFIPIAEDAGIDHFSVFSGDEALRVFNALTKKSEIMVMGWLDQDELEWAIINDISFWIFEPERLDSALKISRILNKPARIHLEIETGMNRTGLSIEALNHVLKLLISYPDNFIFEGVCTHYAGAESIANFVRVNRQISRFNKIYKSITKLGLKPKYRHTACSAAALNYPKTRMDMVRFGIAHYGLWPNTETFIQYIHGKDDKTDPLDRLISWKSQIMSLKKVNEGEFISYGTSYLAQEEKMIAIVPVGYSHGFNRTLSNLGRVLVHGQRIGVIGMVNMNMLIVDVSNLPDVSIGDEVVIIGKQGDLQISVASFSEISNEVNYELLVRLPEQINRIIKN